MAIYLLPVADIFSANYTNTDDLGFVRTEIDNFIVIPLISLQRSHELRRKLEFLRWREFFFLEPLKNTISRHVSCGKIFSNGIVYFDIFQKTNYSLIKD